MIAIKRCVIIYNPNSGRGIVRKYIEEIKEIVMDKEYDVSVIATKYRGHAVSIIENLELVDLVMSFGGDGTFNEVMTGNLNRKDRLLLTHIPVGTTNDIGSMLGYKKNIIDNVRLSLNGVVKGMDIGIINNHPFIYVAGIGKFTNLSYETPRGLKKKIGHLAYVKEGVKAFFKKTRMYDISYKIDGDTYRGIFSLVLISNANHIAGISNVYKDVLLDDDQFEVVFCNIRKKKDIIKTLYFLAKYGPSRVPGFNFYRTNNIEIILNNYREDTWCVDGERLKEEENGRYDVRICNDVKILIPKRNVKKLFRKK